MVFKKKPEEPTDETMKDPEEANDIPPVLRDPEVATIPVELLPAKEKPEEPVEVRYQGDISKAQPYDIVSVGPQIFRVSQVFEARGTVTLQKPGDAAYTRAELCSLLAQKARTPEGEFTELPAAIAR